MPRRVAGERLGWRRSSTRIARRGNIFQTGGVTQAALDYLQTPGFQQGHINEIIADANFTIDGGEYGIQTPWSDRGVGLNVGGEYRKEALHLHDRHSNSRPAIWPGRAPR